MKELQINANVKPTACLCSSDSNLEKLIDGSNKLSNGERFVLLLKNDNSLADRILPAYLNAYLRYKEGNMKADGLQIEMLLFISGTLNIGKAIKETGAKSNTEFIMVSSDSKSAARFIKENKVKIKERYKLEMKLDSFSPVIA